jgi:hypothetical protein
MPIPGVSVWFTKADANGRFAFHGIPPGTYVAMTQAPTGQPGLELTASADVNATEGAMSEVTLSLRAGVSVSGSLDLDSLSGVDARRLTVDINRILSPADWEVPAGMAVADAEGKFVVNGLAPGLHSVRVRGLPDGWRLDSAMFDAVDAADAHLRVESRPISGGC